MTDRTRRDGAHTELRRRARNDETGTGETGPEAPPKKGASPRPGDRHAHAPALDRVPEPLDEDEIDDLFNDMPV